MAGFFLLIATLFAGLGWFAHTQNQIAMEDDARLSKAMIGVLSKRVYNFARDYAYWDDAIRHIFVTRDEGWLRSSYYAGIDDIDGIDGLFVFETQDQSLLRYATDSADPLDELEGQAAELARAVASAAFTEDQPYTGYSMQGDTLLVWGAFPYLVQDKDRAGVNFGADVPVLVLYGKYSPARLMTIATDFNLQNFKADKAQPHAATALTMPSLGADERIGLLWTIRRPGDALMRALLLPVAIIVVIAAYLYLRSRTTTQNLFTRLYAREAALSRQQAILVEHAQPTSNGPADHCDGDNTIDHLLEEYGEVLGASHASFWTWSDDGRFLLRTHNYHVGEPSCLPPERIKTEQCACLTDALGRGETIVVETAAARTAFAAQHPGVSALITDRCFLLCPLFLSGELVGILYGGHGERGRSWSQEDIIFTRSAANIISLTLMFRQLEAARVAASDASRAKSLFLSNMSHELRTPLNAVIGFSELLMTDAKAGKLQKNAYESLYYIHQSGVHLLDIIQDMLDFAALGRGDYQVDDDLVDLSACLGEAVETVQGDLNRKKVTLDVDGLDNRSVRLDRRVVVRSLEQLLSNAVKYSPEGGVVEVRLGESADDGCFAISIQDQGPGMTRDQLAAATEPFYKADDSLTQKNGGTGVGLALVKSLVESQEGKLRLLSRPGRGMRVKLVFPLSRLHFSSAALGKANHGQVTPEIYAEITALRAD